MANNRNFGCSLFLSTFLVINLFLIFYYNRDFALFCFLSVVIIVISILIANFFHTIYLIKYSKKIKNILRFDTKSFQKQINDDRIKSSFHKDNIINHEYLNFILKSKIFDRE
jgi:hypothetical protein